MATKQEIFNKVCKHLLTQNAKAQELDNRGHIHCVYRAANGHKCAVGALIPDELYKPEFEGKNAESLLLKYRDLVPYILPSDCLYENDGSRFVCQLQNIHDEIPVDDWSGYLEFFAKTWNLEFPNIQELAPPC